MDIRSTFLPCAAPLLALSADHHRRAGHVATGKQFACHINGAQEIQRVGALHRRRRLTDVKKSDTSWCLGVFQLTPSLMSPVALSPRYRATHPARHRRPPCRFQSSLSRTPRQAVTVCSNFRTLTSVRSLWRTDLCVPDRRGAEQCGHNLLIYRGSCANREARFMPATHWTSSSSSLQDACVASSIQHPSGADLRMFIQPAGGGLRRRRDVLRHFITSLGVV